MNIYELGEEWLGLQNALLDSEGELDEETEKKLDEFMVAEESKMKGYIMVRANLKAKAEATKKEADRLTAKARAATNAVARMEARLVEHLSLREVQEIETPLGKVKLQFSERVHVDVKEEELPSRFRVKKIAFSADKKAITDALKSDNASTRRAAQKIAGISRHGHIRVY